MPDLVTARTIAMLCAGLPIDDATALIEQYVRSEAAKARYEAVRDTYEEVLGRMGSTETLVPHAS